MRLLRTETVLALSTLAAFQSTARGDADADALKALLKGAKSVDTRDVEISAAAKDKLTAALGKVFNTETDAKVALHTAKDLPNPDENADPETFDSAWAVVASVGESRVAILAFRDPGPKDHPLTVARAVLLAPANAPDSAKAYANVVRWKTLGPSAYEPVDAFFVLRKASESATDEFTRQTRVLLDHLEQMQEIDAYRETLKEAAAANDDVRARKAAIEIAEEFNQLKELYAKTDFVLHGAAEARQKQRALLDERLADAQREARSLSESVEAKNWKQAVQRAGAMSCAKCHGSFEKAFQEERAKRKIADGYFVPGHDLPPPQPEAKRLAPDIAAAARKALLVLDQILPR